MAANIYDWSVVAASNSNSDSDLTWAEGQAPSTVNNAARVMMQRGKQLLVDIGGSIAAGGTANGLTVTASSPFTAYADGMIISFRATASNTGAATLSVNGIGAKAIRKMDGTGDVALTGNEIRNTGIYIAQYSAALNGAAGAWLLVNPTAVSLSAGGSGVFTNTLTGCVLTNDAGDATNDISVSVGTARDTTDVYTIYLASAIVKRGDAAWAVGTGNGAMDTGSITNGNSYAVWLIRRPDTGVVDALFSLSFSAPTMPANYTQKSLIGVFYRTGGLNTLPRSYSQPYTDWASYTPTFTGWGTATAITFKWQRLAGTCMIYGRWVSGITTAVEARITLPPLLFHSGNSLDFGGPAIRDAAAAISYNVLLEDSVQYMTFGRQDASTSGFTKALGNALASTGQTLALQATFQPKGW